MPLHELKNFGIHDETTVSAVGGNAKLDEFRSAMGICNLRNIEKYIAARKTVYDRYTERLDGVDGLVPFRIQENVKPNYAYFPVYIGMSFVRLCVKRISMQESIFIRQSMIWSVTGALPGKRRSHMTCQ